MNLQRLIDGLKWAATFLTGQEFLKLFDAIEKLFDVWNDEPAPIPMTTPAAAIPLGMAQPNLATEAVANKAIAEARAADGPLASPHIDKSKIRLVLNEIFGSGEFKVGSHMLSDAGYGVANQGPLNAMIERIKKTQPTVAHVHESPAKAEPAELEPTSPKALKERFSKNPHGEGSK